MNTVYLGTSGFAATVLRRLADSPHRPSLVLTRPDRPRGRGRKLAAPPIADEAQALGIEVFQPPSVNEPEALERISATGAQLLIVCAFGALIKEPLLSAFRILNVHPSLLPRWRGAAPVERALMAGDGVTGVSIMELTAGLDSGPVCLQEEVAIEADDTYGTLAPRLSALGGELLVRALDSEPSCAEQSEDGVTYAEKITAEDRLLDPGEPAVALERVVRALTPHIGAHVALDDGELLGVRRTRVVADGPPNGILTLTWPRSGARLRDRLA